MNFGYFGGILANFFRVYWYTTTPVADPDRCIKPNYQTKNLLLKGIQLKICFLNNFLNRCKSLPAYMSLDIYIYIKPKARNV